MSEEPIRIKIVVDGTFRLRFWCWMANYCLRRLQRATDKITVNGEVLE